MNFELAFSYVFKDPDWIKKVLIISVIQLIPILGQLVAAGWMLEITRRVGRGETPEHCLPDLDFGTQLLDGLKMLLVGFVYFIPVLIFLVPVILIWIPWANYNQDPLIFVGTLSFICGMGLLILYGIALAFLMPAALGRMAMKDSLGAAFHFGEVFKLIKRAPMAYLIVVLGGWVASLIAPLGGALFGIGAVLTATYANAINGHLYGQAYREAIPQAAVAPQQPVYPSINQGA